MKRSFNLFSCLAALMLLAIPALGETEDFGNTADLANEVAVGEYIQGELESGDTDWIKFTPEAHTRYKISFFNPDSNWKYFYEYQDEGYTDLTYIISDSVHHSSSSREFFFEYASPVYLRATGSEGQYTVLIEQLETVLPDNYGNVHEDATEIIIDADSTVGTIVDDETLEYVDWFTFHTDQLFKYHITLAQDITSNLYFKIYDSTGAVEVYGGSRDITLTSLHGEDYKILVYGTDATVGNYYELRVDFDSEYVDEHGNTPAEATTIFANTQYTETIEYNSDINSDEDWFVFNPAGNARYLITVNNQVANWKYIFVYQDRGQENIEHITNISANNGEVSMDLFFDSTEPVYIQVKGSGGDYDLEAVLTEIFLPDGHSQSIETATNYTVNGGPVTGTISSGQATDSDWFVFQTQTLHKYHLTISQTVNSNVYFKTYDQYGNEIYGGVRDITLASWNGEPYIVRVYGDVNRIGNYYQLSIEDVASYSDDHSNIIDNATEIDHDGTEATGIINFEATVYNDEDWMTFIAPMDGSYDFSLVNEASNWKYYYIYRYNDLNNLVNVFNGSVHNNTWLTTRTLTAGRYYIKIVGYEGPWRVSVLSPEARCGDLEHPYPASDANKDCIVDLRDMAIMASEWLADNTPEEIVDPS